MNRDRLIMRPVYDDKNTVRKMALVLLPVCWPNMAPLGLAALKGYLSQNNISVSCLDYNNFFYKRVSPELQKEWQISSNVDIERDIYKILHKQYNGDFNAMIDKLLNFEILGMTCYKSNIETTVKVAQILKKNNPSIKIVLGGPEIASRYFVEGQKLKNTFCDISDFLVVGEGEKPLKSYLTKGRGGGFIASYQEIGDPSELAIPDYSDFDLPGYPRKSAISLIYSKGCVKRCKFCSERLLYRRFKICPVSYVLKQIQYHKNLGINQFIFHDSLINGDLKALESLCDAIIDNFGSVQWEAQIAIRNDMPDSLFSKIKQSGCYHLFVGLESGCDSILKKMNKGFVTQDAVNFFQRLKSHGLSFGISIIVGFPGETEGDFNETLNFVLQNSYLIPKIEQVNPFVKYNGINFPKKTDYRYREESVKRAHLFIEKIRQTGFKYTKAFMMNLVEPSWK